MRGLPARSAPSVGRPFFSGPAPTGRSRQAAPSARRPRSSCPGKRPDSVRLAAEGLVTSEGRAAARGAARVASAARRSASPRTKKGCSSESVTPAVTSSRCRPGTEKVEVLEATEGSVGRASSATAPREENRHTSTGAEGTNGDRRVTLRVAGATGTQREVVDASAGPPSEGRSIPRGWLAVRRRTGVRRRRRDWRPTLSGSRGTGTGPTPNCRPRSG